MEPNRQAETRPKSQGDRRQIVSWCLYDFANSPFTTLIVTFVYATYFSEAIVGDSERGTVLWSRGVTITAIVVALLSPVLGALADRAGTRKLFLVIATGISVVFTALLYPVEEGQVFWALTFFVIANIAFEMGMVFYNAFLPDIAPPSKIGRVSGYGWGLGYVGGLVALVLALVLFVLPEAPWFGLSKEGGENVRATNLLVAVWFVVFSLPIFLWVKEDRSAVSRGGEVLGDTVRQLMGTWQEIRRYREIMRFLLARLVYNDGLVTIIAFGAIFAAGTHGFTLQEVLVFGIVLNVTAGLGAFVLGYFDDKLGGKRTIQISLIGLIVASILAVASPSRTVFWIAGTLVGVFMGPNQSASRSLMGRFVPPERENEFFGFFAFSGKATAFVGPFLLGLLVQVFDSQRIGVSTVIVLFILGYVLLLGVDEEAGIRAAARTPDA